MRKFIISMIVVFGIIAAALIFFMFYIIGSRSAGVSFGSASAKLVNTSSYRMDGIESLILEYSMDDIILYESDTNELKLMEYMSIVPEERELTRVNQSGSRLHLRKGDKMRRNWLFFNYTGYVEVYLPSGYAGSLSASTSSGNIRSELILHLNSYEASSTSGDISFSGVSAKNISVSSSSGSISFEKASADRIEVSSTSGDIRFDEANGSRSFSSSSGSIRILGGDGDSNLSSTSGNITVQKNTGKLNAHASSGNITIEDASGSKEIETTSGFIKLSHCSGFLRASSSSGDIRVLEQAGAGSFESTSGNINVDFIEDASVLHEDISADASSGSVSFRLPSGLSFEFEARTSSGEIRTYFDDSLSFQRNGDRASGTVGSNPAQRIRISTTSGNITIKN